MKASGSADLLADMAAPSPNPCGLQMIRRINPHAMISRAVQPSGL